MPGRNFNSEWLHQNSLRAYPFMDSSECVDTTASFTIPTDFLLDMAFTVPMTSTILANHGEYYVSKIQAFSNGFFMTISAGSEEIGIVQIATQDHEWGKIYSISGTGEAEGSYGTVVVGYLDSVINEPVGTWEFTSDQTLLQPRCITLMPQGITSLRTDVNGEESEKLFGNIVLTAGINADFDISQDGDTSIITINAIGEYEDVNYITSISGVTPDENGNVDIIPGNSCIEIGTAAYTVSIADLCADPCCGCEELESIQAALEAIQSQYNSLQVYASSLNTKVSDLDAIVTSSLAQFPNQTIST